MAGQNADMNAKINKGARRQVEIKRVGDTWAVAYVDRRKYQRLWAAGFYAPDHSQNDVVEWVNQNPKLELVFVATRPVGAP